MLNSVEYFSQVNLLEQGRAQEKNFYSQRENQRRMELGVNQKTQAIQSALQVDQNTAMMLADIASLDVQVAMAKYNKSADEIQEMRNALSKLGISLLSLGSGMTTGGTTVNIGGK